MKRGGCGCYEEGGMRLLWKMEEERVVERRDGVVDDFRW